jgi:subtilisin family serine protease
VAATDSNDNLASYSNYGASSVDLAAPGSRILSTVPAFTRPLRESFELDISSTWTAGGTGTAWSRGLDSSGYFATDSASGTYQPSSDTWLATASPTSLAGLQDCRLTYSLALNTEQGKDFLKVEASSDATSWSQISSWSGTTGTQWTSGNDDLHAFDGGPVYLRFRLTSNLLIESDGVAIDEVEIKCLTPTFAGTELSYFSGTSMATPYVAGAAALLVSLVPDPSVVELRDALLGGVDPSPNLAGKTVTGGRLNLNKALALAAPNLLPAATPTESPTPASTPSPPTVLKYARSVTLTLRGHLRAVGNVSAGHGVPVCFAGVKVALRRNGHFLKTVSTDATGHFVSTLRDRRGSYLAVVQRSATTKVICGAARSAVFRHSN